MVTDANTILKLPEVIESTSYTADLPEEEFPTAPNFLERALFLHDHGFFKEYTIQELRERLRNVYRKEQKLRDILNNDDVWQ